MIEMIREMCKSICMYQIYIGRIFVFFACQKCMGGLRGNVGGSVSDQGYQDVWISGGSVRYDYEDKPW